MIKEESGSPTPTVMRSARRATPGTADAAVDLHCGRGRTVVGMSIVKWIRARTTSPAAFDAEQQGWRVLTGASGFGGQLGGWSAYTPGRAVVVAFWASRTAHDAFLATAHDDLAEDQRGTYSSVEVDVLERAVSSGIGETVPPSSGVLRTASCRLRPGRLGHVLDVQNAVWLPAMLEAGMLWGLLARPADGAPVGNEAPDPGPEGDIVVVLSAWPSRTVHDRYQQQRVPGLRRRADVSRDFTSVQGDLADLEPSWSVEAE